MGLLPEPTFSDDIATDFGTVRYYVFENGRFSGAPMWFENIQYFTKDKTVILFDVLGDAGYSEQKYPIKDAKSQAAWMNEYFEIAGIKKCNLVAHSFGGWLATNYAVQYPERIETLILLEPVFTFQGLKPSIILKSIPASIPFLPQSFRDGLLEDIGGTKDIDYNDPVARMINYASTYYSIETPMPNTISEDELKSLNMPVYVAMADKSPLHDSFKAVEVAKGNIKDVKAKVWENSIHSLPMEYPEEIAKEILDFIGKK